jgi:hypothetical protein
MIRFTAFIDKNETRRRTASLPGGPDCHLLTWGRARAATGYAQPQPAEHNKSPEVMLISFVSASSSRLDPNRPAIVASLRVATRDLAWAPGSPPTG